MCSVCEHETEYKELLIKAIEHLEAQIGELEGEWHVPLQPSDLKQLVNTIAGKLFEMGKPIIHERFVTWKQEKMAEHGCETEEDLHALYMENQDEIKQQMMDNLQQKASDNPIIRKLMDEMQSALGLPKPDLVIDSSESSEEEEDVDLDLN